MTWTDIFFHPVCVYVCVCVGARVFVCVRVLKGQVCRGKIKERKSLWMEKQTDQNTKALPSYKSGPRNIIMLIML